MALGDLFDWTIPAYSLDFGGGDLSYLTDPEVFNLVQQNGLGFFNPELTTAEIMADTAGRSFAGNIANAGTPLNLGVEGTRPLQTDISLGAFNPLGRVNPNGSLDTLGFAEMNNAFGGPAGPGGAGTAAARLKDAIDNLTKAAPGSSGGGGSSLGISMPRVESPVAERIGAVPVPQIQTGALTAGSPPPSAFTPLNANVPLAQTPADMRALARLLRGEAA